MRTSEMRRMGETTDIVEDKIMISWVKSRNRMAMNLLSQNQMRTTELTKMGEKTKEEEEEDDGKGGKKKR